MYYEMFGLSEPPFQLTPDSRYLFFSKIHKRAKAYMDYAVWKRDGFVVLTGEIGAGKTTLINKLLTEIGDDIKVIRIFQTQLNENEFLQAMLYELGVSNAEIHGKGKVELLHNLNSLLIEFSSRGLHVVLIIDEGQNLSSNVLEEIRMLSGLELDQEKLLNIILVGQPEMNDMLDQPNMAQLVQRIRLRFHLGALQLNESIEYIHHRLKVAGSKIPDKIFQSETYPIIQKYTGGIPRKLNVLCDTALVCSFADNKSIVDVDTVNDALGELQWDKVINNDENNPHVKHQEQTSSAVENAPTKTNNKSEIPPITVDNKEWLELFSTLIKILGDITNRMHSLDNQLEKIENRLDKMDDNKLSNKVSQLSSKKK